MQTLSRRHLLGLTAALLAARPLAAETLPKVHVVKDANCGCCNDWIGHIREAGSPVSFEDMDPGPLADHKASLGLQPTQVSCHTAQVEGYVIEGHVPAREIHRLLKEKPTGIGLAVPGMPVGSPGMDGPAYGNRRDPYDVLLILADGSSRIFESYR